MKTADPELMRAINRFHVMDAIRRFGPLSRVEISERTDLSPTTVSAITAALLDDGLIATLQLGALRDASRGRPRVMLRLNPDAARVVGVKLAPDLITVAVSDFCANLISKLALPIRIHRQTPAVIADLVEDGVRRCVSDAELGMKDIAGLCVGLPGVVANATGVCRQSPIFSERDVGFGDLLSRRLGVAVAVDSDVNLVALAEHWFGQGRELDDFLVVSIERSLGLGILHKGELFRGANGLSPDLGDFMVLGAASAGARLGDLASEDSLLADVEGQSTGEGDGVYAHDKALARAVQRAEAGEAKYARALAHAGEALGFAIANLITLFAPPKVLICGRALASSERLLAPLRQTVAALLPPSLADVAEIVVREWSDDIWVRGAAAMTLRELYGASWGTTGPAKPKPDAET
ncbi:MAG TPA: ROK family transcriptional regulator [Roseiarcus sp.]|nr:ROK family transcriptional regulator [Roseiarcus sp.]